MTGPSRVAADLAIHAHGLGKSFGARVGVTGVDIALRRGETLALVGANGGGKTTTLRLLAGLLRPDEGHAQVLGLDLRRAGRRVAAHAAYMSQKIALYPDLSVQENLRFRAALRGLPRPAHAAVENAGRFGLTKLLDRACGTLSEGWARRTQLAATVLGEPALLLLDEPTAGLDPIARSEVWEHIATIAREGAAVVVSTHDALEAEACSAVLVLMGGRVAAEGAPGAILAAQGCDTLVACLRQLAARQATE